MTWKHHQTGRQNSRKQNVCREQAHSRDEWPAPSLIFYCKQQEYLPMYSRALRGERMGLTAMMAPRIPPLPLQPVLLMLNLWHSHSWQIQNAASIMPFFAPTFQLNTCECFALDGWLFPCLPDMMRQTGWVLWFFQIENKGQRGA